MKAILFDLDGTLWSALDSVVAVWNTVLREELAAHRAEITKDRMAACMGKSIDEIGACFFPELLPEEIHTLMCRCSAAENEYLRTHGGVLYPGVEEALLCLKRDYLLAVVSNCQDGYLQAFLSAHGLADLFADYEMAGRTGLTKGGNIRLVLKRNGVTDAVYVGDTTGDETAAREAGIPFIHAAYGFGTAEAPDAVVRNPGELSAAVNTLFQKEVLK